jgi:aromatic ring-opening dioxygenase LigB subunit
MLTYGFFVPHAPALVPAVGGESTRLFGKTVNSLLTLALRLREHKPDTLVVLTPHAELDAEAITVHVPVELDFVLDYGGQELQAQPQRTLPRDRILTAQLIEAFSAAGLKVNPAKVQKLDYGTSVPLYYLTASLPEVELVSVGVSLAGADAHAALGKAIRAVADESGKKVVLIGSGELSHKLTKASVHGYQPTAAAWDASVLELLREGRAEELLALDPWEREEVGECGYRSLAALLGAFGGVPHRVEVLGYEAPTGIGLAVAYWERTDVY